MDAGSLDKFRNFKLAFSAAFHGNLGNERFVAVLNSCNKTLWNNIFS
jgi:hypothetical protein